MTQLIDRRKARNKSTVNRRRFLLRYKQQIKRAVFDAIGKRSITEIDQGEQITIPSKDITEPRFQQGQGGQVERILPGNDQFISGDRVNRPNQNSADGDGSEASNTGEGNDDFVFQLSREEFLEMYFEDLELPDLVKKELAQINTFKTVRAGVTTTGIPTNINILRSMRQATGRRMAFGSSYKRRLREAEKELQDLESQSKPDKKRLDDLLNEIDVLKKKVIAVPFIDSIDLRYNNRVRIPAPTTQAVMFCLMDVSGSMDEAKKDIAKRFFILLYLFLKRNYAKIELVFIRHHTSAKEVDENDFFYSRETGGTVVSSALELLSTTIEKRYNPAAWNIYVAQASDGDNWNADSPYCFELMRDKIMPLAQYFAYIEIMPRHHQSLWEVYEHIQKQYPNFAMENIDNVANIYPVFRELFKRKTV
ncbi:MAG: YeaH/YhbH family protein [Legionellaceae bacterium]|nr:YeaH/YhbH family protein [Legionellaceae bacterium]